MTHPQTPDLPMPPAADATLAPPVPVGNSADPVATGSGSLELPDGLLQHIDQPDQAPVEAGQDAEMRAHVHEHMPGMTTSMSGANSDAADTPDADCMAQLPVPGLSGEDAPMQTPLTEPAHVLELIKDGYAVDPLYSVDNESGRSNLGTTPYSSVHERCRHRDPGCFFVAEKHSH